MNYLVLRNGKTEGPFTPEQMSAMQSAGAFPADIQFMGEGGSKWLPISLFACVPKAGTTLQVDPPRLKVRRWSQASIVLFTLGIVGLFFGGLGIAAIVAAACLPWAHKFYCGYCKKEVPLERDTCPYCGKRMGLVQEASGSQLSGQNGSRPAAKAETSPFTKIVFGALILASATLVLVFAIVNSAVFSGRESATVPSKPEVGSPRLTSEEYDTVCRGAVAFLYAQPLEAISIEKHDGETVYLFYIRRSDQTIWRTRCRIQGNQILWGNSDGRWRTDPRDEQLYFKLDRGAHNVLIRQRYSDGTFDDSTFPL